MPPTDFCSPKCKEKFLKLTSPEEIELKKQKIREYRLKNREKLKKYQREYRLKNKEQCRIRDRNYRLKNKEKIREYQREYFWKKLFLELKKKKERKQND